MNKFLTASLFATSFVISVFIGCIPGFCQTPHWIFGKGGIGDYSTCQAVAPDASGNMYIAGGFMSNNIFGHDTLISSGGMDAYLSKLDSGGNFLWTVTISGNLADIVYDVAVDQQRNSLYIAGQTSSYDINCNSTSVPVYTVSTVYNASTAPFLAKYDLNGNLKWIKFGTVSTSGVAPAARVKVDRNGNVVLGGSFSFIPSTANTLTLDGVTLTNHNSTEDFEIFLFKFDTMGHIIWSRQSNGGVYGTGQGEFFDMAVDDANNIYVTTPLYFGSTIDFGNGVVLTHPNPGHQPSVLVKYNANGMAQWGKIYGTTGSSRLYVQSLRSYFDGERNFLYMGGQVVNGNFTLAGTALAGTSDPGLFLAKLDDSGNAVWAKPINSITIAPLAIPEMFRIAVDQCGAAYFAGLCPWDEVKIDTMSRLLNGTLYVAKIDSSGSCRWIQTATSSTNVVCKTDDIALTANGEVVIAGYHEDMATPCNVSFGSSALSTNPSSMALMFFAKLSPAVGDCHITIDSAASVSNMQLSEDLAIYPNPANENLNIIAAKSISEIRICDIVGRQRLCNRDLHKNAVLLSTENIESGTYIIRVRFADGEIVNNRIAIIHDR